jgi:hypothetical protein
MRELAQEAVAQTRENYEQIEIAANELASTLVSTQSTAARSIANYRAWLMKVAHRNVISAFDFAQNRASRLRERLNLVRGCRASRDIAKEDLPPVGRLAHQDSFQSGLEPWTLTLPFRPRNCSSFGVFRNLRVLECTTKFCAENYVLKYPTAHIWTAPKTNRYVQNEEFV